MTKTSQHEKATPFPFPNDRHPQGVAPSHLSHLPYEVAVAAKVLSDEIFDAKSDDAAEILAAAFLMAERERCGKYATDQAEREPYGHCKATAYLIADNIMGAK